VPPELAVGARNAVRTCLAIGPADRVAIIRDLERQSIAEAVAEAVQTAGGRPPPGLRAS
jgi:hypothetical protein